MTLMPSYDEAKQKGEEGLGRAKAKTGREWLDYAYDFSFDYAALHPEFFPEDLWGVGLERPSSPRAYGAVIKKLFKNGVLDEEPIDFRKAKLSNLQFRAVYRSLVYQGDEGTPMTRTELVAELGRLQELLRVAVLARCDHD